MQFPDTIFALSSGKPPSGVAVVRVSGARTREIMTAIAGSVPADRRAVLARFRSPQGETIDRGLALFFACPATFTGEDCAEFHLHGGRAVVSAITELLSSFDKVRPAEAGEFTRRAFLTASGSGRGRSARRSRRRRDGGSKALCHCERRGIAKRALRRLADPDRPCARDDRG